MTEETNETRPTRPRGMGRYVVLGMFAFGILMVGSMYAYWELYTRPFRAMQDAINAEFPGSSPRAIGGRPKSHREESPRTLRIVIQVDFDPNADSTRSEQVAARLAAIAQAHHDVTRYDLLEVHLVQRLPEQASRQWSVSRPIAEWRG